MSQPVASAPAGTPAMYLPALTGLRGLAACWVLVLHLGEFSGSPPLAVPLGFASLDLTALAACGYLGDRSIL